MESEARRRTARREVAALRHRRVPTIGIWLAASFLLICGRAAGAQSANVQAALPAARELTDEMGRRVQVPGEPGRVVSLAPNLTEIVFALGDGNRLAGDTDYCDYPPEALQKPHVGGLLNPNLEQIAALTPDLVLATKSINRRETVEALDRMGLPVYVTDPHSVEEMIGSVEHVGTVLGKERSAAKLTEDLRTRLSDLQRRLAGSEARSVLFVVWADPLVSAGRDTFIADAVRLAGGRSVLDTTADWPHVSLEEIVRLQPDALVFGISTGTDTQSQIDTLRTRPGWRDLEAMRKGNIIIVSDAIKNPAPRMVDAIEQLARALHPEAFPARTVSSRNVENEESRDEKACACAR